ncbi:hypothetical protein AT2G07617 [Arabidopsis thaliana]|nr:uncharacterized protein AT2G07617 [Arabidopsis thaliana]ANM63085.1 hypothetical protein AT2G07617 [Arabidopsis thaliana]|eukprot:NP_001336522.1 hypothetical protein AT2G07617 [Arabidopsis thaliana]
MKMDGLR